MTVSVCVQIETAVRPYGGSTDPGGGMQRAMTSMQKVGWQRLSNQELLTWSRSTDGQFRELGYDPSHTER